MNSVTLERLCIVQQNFYIWSKGVYTSALEHCRKKKFRISWNMHTCIYVNAID